MNAHARATGLCCGCCAHSCTGYSGGGGASSASSSPGGSASSGPGGSASSSCRSASSGGCSCSRRLSKHASKKRYGDSVYSFHLALLLETFLVKQIHGAVCLLYLRNSLPELILHSGYKEPSNNLKSIGYKILIQCFLPHRFPGSFAWVVVGPHMLPEG